MIILKREDVNKKHSTTWTFCNDNSHSASFRTKFIDKFGGEFIKEKRNFRWQIKIKPTSKELRRKLIFEGAGGKIYFVDNMLDFCREHDIKSRARMYELRDGTLEKYKEWKFLGEIPWQT